MNTVNARTSAEPADEAVAGVWLSALADGETDALQPASSAWRLDAEARRTWHAYQLIGDVMRSDDLASPPGHDAAFLAGVRTRLATEPVVLAPMPAARRRRQPWLVPLAAAAGVAVVTGVLVVARIGLPGAGGDAPLLAGAPKSTVGGSVLPVVNVDNDGMLRDAHLQELMRQHRAARGDVAMAAPGGALRSQAVVPVSNQR